MQSAPPQMTKIASGGCMLLFGLLFSSMSLLMAAIAWSVGAPWAFLLFISPFLAVGFGMVGIGAWNLFLQRLLIARAFGPASVTVTPQHVCPGDVIQVRFEQVSRRRQEIGKVSIQLLFRETATWKSGRSTNSAHQSTVMDTYETSGRQLAAGETLSEACVLQVPRSAMHSFSVPNNRLAWVVKVAVAIPGTPDVDEEVIVNVLPQMKEQDA